jgi:hypothetical protein
MDVSIRVLNGVIDDRVLIVCLQPFRRFQVTVQVPQSIFLDKSRGIGYRRVDECESGSPDKATRGSGE